MGSVIALIAALLINAAAQSGLELPWAAPKPLLYACLVGFALLPYAAAMRVRARQAEGKHALASRWFTFTEASGWIGFGVLSLCLGWLGAVREWTGSVLDVNSWPDGALALSLAPFVVYQLCAIDASVRAHGGTASMRRHLRGFQMRILLAAVVPIASFIGLSALIAQSSWLKTQVEHVGLVSALFTGAILIGMAFVLPKLLRYAFDTTPFPEGEERELLEAVAARGNFEPHDIRLWQTGDLFANAAIIGMRKRGRVVLFSDQLVSILSPRELCAVYGHEMGHAVRGHVGIFLAWTAGFFLLGETLYVHVDAAYGELFGYLSIGLLGLSWYVWFGWLSRRYELEADLFSYQTARDLPALVSALERVGGAHRARHGWRHFSVDRRIQFLGRVAADSRFTALFQRRLRLLARIGYGLAAVGLVLLLWGYAKDLPSDRSTASLAHALERGDLDDALTHARRIVERGDADAEGITVVLERATSGEHSSALAAAEKLDGRWRELTVRALAQDK